MKSRSECQHEDFQTKVGVHRLTKTEGGPVTGYMADVEVHCTECGTRFQFMGLEPGLDTQGARVSVDGLQARIAIAPEGETASPLDRIMAGISAKH